MKKLSLITSLIATFAFVLTSCGGGGGNTPSDANNAVPLLAVSSSGGTLQDPATGASIVVAAESLLPASVNITLTSSAPPSSALTLETGGNTNAVGRIFKLQKDTPFDFATPVEVTLPYSTATLSNSDVLTVAYLDDSSQKWIPLPASEITDTRAQGKLTFRTTHFSLWVVVQTAVASQVSDLLTLASTSFDKGFLPAVDGIPFVNFGVAVTPDGKTNHENGSCGGMAAVASWYFKYKKSTDGAASTRFNDDAASNSRSFLAHMQSGYTADTFLNLPVDSLPLVRRRVTNTSAAIEILNLLIDNQMPIVLYGLNLTTKKAHYVTVYKYNNMSREFSFYDPNYPDQEKSFKASLDGSISGFRMLENDVTHFRALLPTRGAFASKEEFNKRYEQYKVANQNDRYSGATWGKFSNLQIESIGTGPAAQTRITGKVSRSPLLLGRQLYMHLSARNDSFSSTSPAGQVASSERYFFTGELNDVARLEADGTFNVTVARSKFVVNAVPIRFLVNTSGSNPGQGLWAYGQATIPAIANANLAPTAAFTANPTTAAPNTAISFNASASTDTDGSIASYAWNFGDGSAGTGVNVSHAYASAGSYTVTLTITDNTGAQSSAVRAVSIRVSPTGIACEQLLSEVVNRSAGAVHVFLTVGLTSTCKSTACVEAEISKLRAIGLNAVVNSFSLDSGGVGYGGAPFVNEPGCVGIREDIAQIYGFSSSVDRQKIADAASCIATRLGNPYFNVAERNRSIPSPLTSLTSLTCTPDGSLYPIVVK